MSARTRLNKPIRPELCFLLDHDISYEQHPLGQFNLLKDIVLPTIEHGVITNQRNSITSCWFQPEWLPVLSTVAADFKGPRCLTLFNRETKDRVRCEQAPETNTYSVLGVVDGYNHERGYDCSERMPPAARIRVKLLTEKLLLAALN